MPSQLQHEINKLRGKLSKTGKRYTDSISSLNDAILAVELSIKALESDNTDFSSKINTATSIANTGINIGKNAIPQSGGYVIKGNLVPNTTQTYSIGSSNYQLYLAYAKKLYASEMVKTDTIGELSVNTGVTIDGVVLKDGVLNAGAGALPNRNRYMFISTPHHRTAGTHNQGTAFDSDANETASYGFRLPADFSSFTSVKVIWLAKFGFELPKNWVLDINAKYGTLTEPYTTHNNDNSANIIEINAANCTDWSSFEIDSSTFSCIGVNDFVTVTLTRDANHASDTYTDDIYVLGLFIEYVADM